MALAWALLVVLVVESLAAVALAAAAARTRLVADRRWAFEAEAALETAMATARVTHDSALAALPPGGSQALAPPVVAGWEVAVVAGREATGSVVHLGVAVRRRDAGGRLVSARRGTLLLVASAADTAIVLDSRPRN